MTDELDDCTHPPHWLRDGDLPGYPYVCDYCGEHLRDPEDDEPDYVVAVLA